MDISLPDSSRRDRLASSSNRVTAQYASRPSRAKAQARGDVNPSTAGNEALKSPAAQRRRDGLTSEREHSPSAQTVRPWLSSEPTSSSQRLSKLKKFRKRFASPFHECWIKDAKRVVSASLSCSSPGAPRAHATSSARALSSTQ